MSVTGVVWDALAGGAVAVVGVFILLALGGPLVLNGLGAAPRRSARLT